MKADPKFSQRMQAPGFIDGLLPHTPAFSRAERENGALAFDDFLPGQPIF